MTTVISTPHRRRLEEIRRTVGLLGCKESNFIRVELLFFEVLDLSREYGTETATNPLLADLLKLQEDQYEKTKAPTARRTQKEIVIRHFISGFKRILSYR